jgi:hypothetical protein
VLADLPDAAEPVLLEEHDGRAEQNRPTAARPAVTAEMASALPPPARPIWSSAAASPARAMPWPRCFLST